MNRTASRHTSFRGVGSMLGVPGLSTSVGLVILVTACATGAPAPGGSPAGSTATISPSEGPAAYYSDAGPARAATDRFVIELRAELDRWTKRLGRPALVEDARFDQVARDMARITAERGVPASSVVTSLLSHYGVIEPEPNLIMIKGALGTETSAIADLGKQLDQIGAANGWRRVGIGVWRSGDTFCVVLSLHEHNLELAPLPRVLPSGGHAKISGRVLGVYRSPEVIVTSPASGVHRLPAQVRGSSFTARLDCNLADGVYQVEVSAEDQRGPTVLANFPIYCGVVPTVTLQIAESPAPSIVDPDDIERQILDLMDRDRQANGLPTLVRDARLARVARRYSREMAAVGEVAHFSRQSGNAVDRVRAGGIAPMPTLVAENVGRDYSAVDVERGFMASPGHRENILSRAVTHVGVGVALGQSEGNNTPIFVTQILVGWGK